MATFSCGLDDRLRKIVKKAKSFKNLLTTQYIYDIINTTKQYKINVFYIYVLGARERREVMSGYKQRQKNLDSVHKLWEDLLYRKICAD